MQVNFCKNPLCQNFGVPASQNRPKRTDTNTQTGYTVKGSEKVKGAVKLVCKCCREQLTVKSNLAITEELGRMKLYLRPPEEPSCKNVDCENHKQGVHSQHSKYQQFGASHSGSKRYRCKSCLKTFTVNSKATLRQRFPHKNKEIFKLLMNKVPFKRVCEIASIRPKTLYDKIDFIHKQCLASASERESALLSGIKKLDKLYLSTDRQEYVVNWTMRKDKRNVRLGAIGTADNTSGYVFGMHLNFDASFQQEAVEMDAAKINDCDLKPAFRKHARLWLQCDYENRQALRIKAKTKETILDEVRETYDEALLRDDIEKSDGATSEIKLPGNGMQVHSEYTMYAHFKLLNELLNSAEKVRFFLDQDSGIRAAFMSSFADKVKARTADAFYVRIAKDLTIDEKRKILNESAKVFKDAEKRFPDLSKKGVELAIIKERMSQMTNIGKWNDRWLLHPKPNMSEPEKAICCLTDLGDYDDDHMARLYDKATIRGIDRFFMQIRRMLSILERPIGTSSRAGRMWHGYSAYNPEIIVKLLDIFRVYYNYVGRGDIKTTPAMKLGLAKGLISMEDIIYFKAPN